MTPPLVAARSSRRPVQAKAATTNRVRDYEALEREFITGTMSLRELCCRHGVTAHMQQCPAELAAWGRARAHVLAELEALRKPIQNRSTTDE